jgi:tRNA pseudouridine(55) synthase
MLNGWIILDKPLGLGSTQAVGAVKRALREGGYPKVKIGHGGTLDPLATGVLPIALGEATKLAGRMLDSDKIYEFTVNFGAETDSLDLEGTVIAESDVRPNLADIVAILPRFTGPIEQVPPAFSAIKVDGKRAYDLARAGEAVELKSRAVVIYALDLNTAPERGGGPPRSGGGGARRRSRSVLGRSVGTLPHHSDTCGVGPSVSRFAAATSPRQARRGLRVIPHKLRHRPIGDIIHPLAGLGVAVAGEVLGLLD